MDPSGLTSTPLLTTLLEHSAMNMACLLQSALQLHTWRPAFPYYSWYAHLLMDHAPACSGIN